MAYETGKRPLGRNRRISETILEWTLKRQISIRGIELIRLRIGIIGECGIEPPVSIIHGLSNHKKIIVLLTLSGEFYVVLS